MKQTLPAFAAKRTNSPHKQDTGKWSNIATSWPLQYPPGPFIPRTDVRYFFGICFLACFLVIVKGRNKRTSYFEYFVGAGIITLKSGISLNYIYYI